MIAAPAGSGDRVSESDLAAGRGEWGKKSRLLARYFVAGDVNTCR